MNLINRLGDLRTPLGADVVGGHVSSMMLEQGHTMHEAALCASVNSDDPSYFGEYINENSSAIQQALNFSDDEPGRLVRIAFASAYLSDHLHNRNVAELERHRPPAESEHQRLRPSPAR